MNGSDGNGRITIAICRCGHERTGHTYDPRDYDRYDCQTCECRKFESAMIGRDLVIYPPRSVPMEVKYRETESTIPVERVMALSLPFWNKDWDGPSS